MRHETAISQQYCHEGPQLGRTTQIGMHLLHGRYQGRRIMADSKSLIDILQKNVAVWLLSSLVVGAAALVIWWFASDIVVAIIKAFEVVIWLLGLMLWPFRL
jgi:hypothetical protein